MVKQIMEDIMFIIDFNLENNTKWSKYERIQINQLLDINNVYLDIKLKIG